MLMVLVLVRVFAREAEHCEEDVRRGVGGESTVRVLS